MAAGGVVQDDGTKRRFISWPALAPMTTASVASLRPSPSTAVHGLAAVFLHLLPALVLLLPTALVGAELASSSSGPRAVRSCGTARTRWRARAVPEKRQEAA
ncbi:hypothetical protein [Streptomyces sp. NPDC093089]|uniref:hypothetical protein n=1 Tax=Streptomyces sp. NPDC093089 TaxID=3366024 RepID=UPI0037F13DA1